MAPPIALRWLPAAAEVAGGAAAAFHFGPPLCCAPAAAQARTLQQTTSTRYYGKSLYECVVNAGLTTTKQMIDVSAHRAVGAACRRLPCMLLIPQQAAPPGTNRLPPDLFRIACAAVGREPCRVCGQLALQALLANTVPGCGGCARNPVAPLAVVCHLTVQAAGPEVISLFTNPTLAITFLAPDNQNWLT